MIRHVFVFGVVVPTVITVVFFVGFLVCWFKFNMRERLLNARIFKRKQQLKQVVYPQQHKLPDASDACQHTWGEQAPSNDPNWKGHDPSDPGGQDHKVQCSQAVEVVTDTKGCGMDSNYFTSTEAEHESSDLMGGDKQRLIVTQSPGRHGNRDLVQQTFHFCAEANQLGGQPSAADSADEDSNYGVFVPRSQVEAGDKLVDEYVKLRQEDSPVKKPPSKRLGGGLIFADRKQGRKFEALRSQSLAEANDYTSIPTEERRRLVV